MLRDLLSRLAPRAPLMTLCAAALLTACGGGDVETPASSDSAEIDAATMKALMVSTSAVPRDIVVMLHSGVAATGFARSYGVAVIDQFGKRPIYLSLIHI